MEKRERTQREIEQDDESEDSIPPISISIKAPKPKKSILKNKGVSIMLQPEDA